MAETRCPFCGFSPIPSGEEACPGCHRVFVTDRSFTSDGESMVTRTRPGGLTGAVTASPVPVALAMVMGAVAWLLRVVDAFAPLKDPMVLLVVPVLLMAGAASVMASVGPAKHAGAALGLVSVVISLLFWTSVPLHNAALIGWAALLVVATISEPSRLRLRLGTFVASMAAVGSVLALAVGGGRAEGVGPVSLEDARVGLRWNLPAGWLAAPGLTGLAPPERVDRRAVLTATNGDGLEAFLVLDRLAGSRVCEDLEVELGAETVKTPETAPSPFPRGTPVMEVIGGARPIRFACARSGQVTLAILVAAEAAPAVLEATLRVLASGALVLADPAGP